MTRWRTRHRGSASDRGAAAVEFAIVFVILIFIIFSIIDFGRLLFAVQSMKAASREGARTAVVGGTGQQVLTSANGSGDTAAAIATGDQHARISFATVVNPAPGDFDLVTSTTTADELCPTAGNSVTIQAYTTFDWFTPTMPFLGTFLSAASVPDVQATTTMRCE